MQAEERIYFTNGRGEIYRTEQIRDEGKRPNPVTMKSKTKWGKSKELIIETSIQINAPVGILPKRLYEQFFVGDDGKTLTRKIKYIDDNEYTVYPKGELAPSKFEEWSEVYHFVTQSDFEKAVKTKN